MRQAGVEEGWDEDPGLSSCQPLPSVLSYLFIKKKNIYIYIYIYIYIFWFRTLKNPHSPTRDRTRAPGNECSES